MARDGLAGKETSAGRSKVAPYYLGIVDGSMIRDLKISGRDGGTDGKRVVEG